MSTPTRLDITEALDALERLEHAAWKGGADWHSELWRNKVIKVIPAPPQPTMAEVEWDDEKHHLAEAIHDYWGEVIMLYRNQNSGDIQYFFEGNRENEALFSPAKLLTPTGRRYVLTEVQE